MYSNLLKQNDGELPNVADSVSNMLYSHVWQCSIIICSASRLRQKVHFGLVATCLKRVANITYCAIINVLREFMLSGIAYLLG